MTDMMLVPRRFDHKPTVQETTDKASHRFATLAKSMWFVTFIYAPAGDVTIRSFWGYDIEGEVTVSRSEARTTYAKLAAAGFATY